MSSQAALPIHSILPLPRLSSTLDLFVSSGWMFFLLCALLMCYTLHYVLRLQVILYFRSTCYGDAKMLASLL